MCARTHFEIFDKNLILHSKFQKKSMLMTQYRLLSHRKWLSIRYWGMLRNALLWGPWSLKFRHLLNRWPWPNIVGCHYCCGPTKPPILDLFAITQYSILSHNKLLSIEYWVLKDTESLYFTISTLWSVPTLLWFFPPPPPPSPASKRIINKRTNLGDFSTATDILYIVGMRRAPGFIGRWPRQWHTQRRMRRQRRGQMFQYKKVFLYT